MKEIMPSPIGVEYISPLRFPIEEAMFIKSLKDSSRGNEATLFLIVGSPKKYIHDLGIEQFIELTEEIKQEKCYKESEYVRKRYNIAKRWISQYQRKHNN